MKLELLNQWRIEEKPRYHLGKKTSPFYNPPSNYDRWQIFLGGSTDCSSGTIVGLVSI
jgi:hypothetical protein